MTDKELEDRIESYYDGVNLFRSIKIKGHFKHMHVRMIPKQMRTLSLLMLPLANLSMR